MTLRQYLSIMILTTILCWIAWGMVLVNIDPFDSSAVGFIFFYTSLFLALLGTVSICAFFLHRLFVRKKQIPMYRSVQRSFLDATVIAVVCVGLLYLQSQSYLHYWNIGILLVLVIFVGLFKLSTHFPTRSQEPT